MPSAEAMNIPPGQASHGNERNELCNSDELPEIEANNPRHEPLDGSFHGTIRDETSNEVITMDTCNSPYDEQSDGEHFDLFISPNCAEEDLGSDCSMNSSRVADADAVPRRREPDALVSPEAGPRCASSGSCTESSSAADTRYISNSLIIREYIRAFYRHRIGKRLYSGLLRGPCHLIRQIFARLLQHSMRL